MDPFYEIPKALSTTPGRYLTVILILLAASVIARIASTFMGRWANRSSRFLKVDPTQYRILKHSIAVIIYMIGIGVAIFIIPTLRTLSISLFAGAGVLAVVIGFASQKVLANILSGISIAISKPFRVGDTIRFQDKQGVVEDITLRHTIIRNFENKRFVVPNSIMSEEVIENYNIEDPRVCRFVEMGISYDSDLNKAMKIMQEEAMKHPDFIDVRTQEDKEQKKPAVPVRVIGFGDSSVNLRAWVWAKDPGRAFVMGCDLNKSIKERFDKEGIEIPFPYRTVVMKKEKRKR